MTLTKRVPRPLKRFGRAAIAETGALTARARMLPTFTVAGAQRSGTTSVYRALMSHPLILPAVLRKGVNYFDLNYHRGMGWYQGHFPLRARAGSRSTEVAGSPITFDASGYYMFHPMAARRMATDLPELKVITMLRDPVERAYSAHRHAFARGFETESFERALELEPHRLEGEVERLLADPRYRSHAHRHQAYVTRGQYVEQLERILEFFPREQLLVVESERFFEQPEVEYRRIMEFLDLPVVMPEAFDRYNARPRAPMADATRERLSRHFEGHDAALGRLLGRDPAWRR
jgi:Sulfotransferase domain